MRSLKYWQAINTALAEELERDERVCVFGEDVGEAGGPFGATMRLQERFGEWRVRDTPISEAVIMGTAVGAAMAGMRPIGEIMFFDFLTLAMDQLVNQAAKMTYMSNGEYHLPLVVRTLCGAHRGSGPQHSQNLEAWIAAVPGLKVVWGSTPADARGLLKSAVRDDDPVVVIESTALWATRGEVSEDPDDVVPIGSAAIRRTGADVTLVSWGAAMPRALAAADALEAAGVSPEVIDLRSLLPLDAATVLESASRTGRLVVVQDATAPCGVGSEVAALAAEHIFGDLRAPVLRLTPPFAPVPSARHLEELYYPQSADISDSVLKLCNA
ncbi:alpha-ketoacid dehydrogenase subunit beta [Actinomadura macra]|uniref:alpha-ketoacid dehydrogenase subunit beta n=1 Tax=Actinomadura macra TaxID=46164 RepID=UPI00082C92A3|nr:alpha-ketoacid dehydrogenase subunit beta [Actinomadura macra]